MKFKSGDKVKLISKAGLHGYVVGSRLRLGKIYTVYFVKASGGLLFKEVNHTENYFGELQGILPESPSGKKRFKKV